MSAKITSCTSKALVTILTTLGRLITDLDISKLRSAAPSAKGINSLLLRLGKRASMRVLMVKATGR